MISKRKKVLLRSVVGAIALAAIGAAVKMLVTDHWSSIDPLVSTAWTWTLNVFSWLAQPIAFPLWSYVAVFLVAIGAIGFLSLLSISLGLDLNEANAKLNPTLPPLDENAQQVLTVIARNGGKGEGLYMRELPAMTGLPQLLYDAGMDTLDRWGLFTISRSAWGNQITLSARGRHYILHPESPLKWVVEQLR